jgi:hypothetical protein
VLDGGALFRVQGVEEVHLLTGIGGGIRNMEYGIRNTGYGA